MSSFFDPSTTFTYLTGFALAIGTFECGEGGSASVIEDMVSDRVFDVLAAMTVPDLNVVTPNI